MAFKVPNVGLQHNLDLILSVDGPNYKCDLYVSNTTPVAGSLFIDFTIASWTGYAQQDIDTWSATAIVSNKAVSTSNVATFTVTTVGASPPVYGYMISLGGVLIYAEKLAAPITPVDGLPISLIATLRLASI